MALSQRATNSIQSEITRKEGKLKDLRERRQLIEVEEEGIISDIHRLRGVISTVHADAE